MDWLESIVAGFVLVVLLTPVAMLVLTVFVLVPLAHLGAHPRMLARSRFECPVSKRTALATFVTSPDGTPPDVAECSLFPGGPVRCRKNCLALAGVAWAPSPMVPRFSLLSGETALR